MAAGDEAAQELGLEESALDLYEHAPCGYLSTDPDGGIVRVNQTFLDWTGHRREELVGRRRLQDLLTPGGRIYHETHYAPLLRMQGSVRGIAADVVRADGTRLPVLLNSVLHRDAAGEPRYVRTTIFDATDRKRYEHELLAARDRERAARARTERLQQMASALAGAFDVPEVAATVTEELVASLGADAAGIALLDAESGRMEEVHRHGGAEPPAATVTGPVFDAGEGSVRGARITLPIGGGPQPDGVVWLAYDAARELSPEERAYAVACVAQATVAFERSRLYEQQRDVAHVLQQSMLADAVPADERFDVAALYRPADEGLEVGGDWHDVFALPGDALGIVVGDVVGRGLAAASAMGQLRSAVRALAGARLAPADVLRHLDTFAEQTAGARYATVAYAEVELGTRRMRFACAGHPPPLLWSPREEPRLLMEGRSAPLGVITASAPRIDAEMRLRPDARLLLYTDGVVERRTESIDEGIARLAAAVAARRAMSARTLVDSLADALIPGAATNDDVCLLCLHLRPAEPQPE